MAAMAIPRQALGKFCGGHNSKELDIQKELKLSCSKERISCSRTAYNIFLEVKAYLNIGN